MTYKARKGGSFAPALCTILGLLIMFSVVAFFAPIALQKPLGYTIYNVVSESMEPAIPVGSAVFVVPCVPEDQLSGQVIAFQDGASVVTHRIVKNRMVEGLFVTKGDANEQTDPIPVSYNALIGRVSFSIPVLGMLMELLTGMLGKIYVLLYLFCGVLFQIIAGRLRSAQKEE